MHVPDRQTVSSTWSYEVELPPQKRIGLIEYYIEIGYENHVAFKYPRDLSPYYQIFIFDDKPPTISVLYPPDGGRFTVGDQTTVRAEVVDRGIVEEVRIYVLGPSAQNQELFKEKSSDMYTKNITLSQVGIVEYYLTATDEAGKESRSENRWLTIKDPKPPPPPAHPTIHLIKPSSTTFNVNQQIPIEAKVTDDTSVERVRLFYSFSPSISEPPRYSNKSLTETSSSMYTGYIPPQSEAGYIWYYLSATDEAGNKSTSENRWLEIIEKSPPLPPLDNKPPTINFLYPPKDAKFTVNQQFTIRARVTDDTAVKEVLVHFSSGNSQTMSKEGSSGIYATDISFSQAGPVEYYLTATDEAGNESKSESRNIKIEKSVVGPLPPRPSPPPTYPIYQGIWASVSVDDAFISGSDGSYMLRLAYLREGKNQSTLGAQLDFSPDRTHMGAIFQWGPTLAKSHIGFTLLGGIATYEDSSLSTHTTPIFGGGLKFYPQDKIVIDATGSFKFRSDYDTTDLYHYEVGIRFYITPELGLRAGYGRLHLGDEDITTLQIGIGVNF